jgi:hypothetical protein
MNAVLNYSIQLANERAVWDVKQFVSMTRPGINERMFLRIHPAPGRRRIQTTDGPIARRGS